MSANPFYEHISPHGDITTSTDKHYLMELKGKWGGEVRPQVVVLKQQPKTSFSKTGAAEKPERGKKILGKLTASELARQTGFTAAGLSQIRKELIPFIEKRIGRHAIYKPEAVLYLKARGKTPGRNRIKIEAEKRKALLTVAKNIKGVK